MEAQVRCGNVDPGSRPRQHYRRCLITGFLGVDDEDALLCPIIPSVFSDALRNHGKPFIFNGES